MLNLPLKARQETGIRLMRRAWKQLLMFMVQALSGGDKTLPAAYRIGLLVVDHAHVNPSALLETLAESASEF